MTKKKTSIKGNITSNVGYTGIVTISQCNKTKKTLLASVHNAGNKPLFDFLADCLVGELDVAKIDVPNKILLLHQDEDSGLINKAGEYGFIHIQTKPERVYNDTAGVVRYSFTIPPEAFIGSECNMLGLYAASASEIDEYSASCLFNINSSTISLSSVVVVDWELFISNA